VRVDDNARGDTQGESTIGRNRNGHAEADGARVRAGRCGRAVALIGTLALLHVAGGDALSGWALIVTGLLVTVGALLGGLVTLVATRGARA